MLIFLAAFCAIAARADEVQKPGDAQLRTAVTKGLEFLDRKADTWMNEKSCNGCHHMPELLWSHREAQRRGFAIDPKMFDEFVDWSSMHAKDTGPGLEMLALLKLAMPEKAAPELTSLILKGQQPDGSWKPAGQMADMQRRGAPDAKTNSARLFLLALGTQPADQAATDTARAKASDLLAKSEPANCVDSLMFRALYARRFGPPEEVAANREDLLKLQHADGGWGYIVGEEQSDPLATGEALYLLQQLPGADSAGSVARGLAWLVGHQREDGGWDIDITRISKLDRSAPAKVKSLKDATGIYTFWGSAWATMGLVAAFPVTAPPNAP
jgi:squalene-hopene/tetraprenyl-beta-curcumene cyclase